MIRSRQRADPSGFPSMSLASPRLRSVKRRFYRTTDDTDLGSARGPRAGCGGLAETIFYFNQKNTNHAEIGDPEIAQISANSDFSNQEMREGSSVPTFVIKSSCLSVLIRGWPELSCSVRCPQRIQLRDFQACEEAAGIVFVGPLSSTARSRRRVGRRFSVR